MTLKPKITEAVSRTHAPRPSKIQKDTAPSQTFLNSPTNPTPATAATTASSPSSHHQDLPPCRRHGFGFRRRGLPHLRRRRHRRRAALPRRLLDRAASPHSQVPSNLQWLSWARFCTRTSARRLNRPVRASRIAATSSRPTRPPPPTRSPRRGRACPTPRGAAAAPTPSACSPSSPPSAASTRR